MPCPICASDSKAALRADVVVYRCSYCEHTFVGLDEGMQERLEQTYSHPGYGGFREDEVFRQSMRDELHTGIGSVCPPPARLLDVGCGNGAFLREASTAGYDALGIDVSEAGVELCARYGLPAEARRVEDMDEGRWDVATLWDVIEHIPSPIDFLTSVRSILRPDGVIFLKTPTVAREGLAMLRIVRPLARSTLHLPGHVNIFSETSIRMALQSSGFDVQRIDTCGDMRSAGPARTARRAVGRIARAPIKRYGGIRNIRAMAVRADSL